MKISFIGAGNMGGAIIEGIVAHGIARPQDITVADKNEESLLLAANRYGVTAEYDNKKAAEAADMLFLCVKPNVLYPVIDEISGFVKNGAIIISIAAGQSIERITKAFGKDNIKIARVMPNTPALVGEGMAAVVPNSSMTDEDTAKVVKVFDSLGKAEVVSENLMDAVTAVSGSAPAYVFMFIEAMADAAVQGGMLRDKAYTFAAQAVLGSAKMVLDTGKHPAELKDMVCSPGGTTIDAVAVLEEEGMRNAVIKAMQACIEKSKSL